MRRTLKFSRLALAIAASAVCATATGFAQAQTVIKIGHVAPLTGNQAHLGKDNENGARLAIDDLNEKKLKINGQDVKFELLPEDDAADPKQGTAVAQKLVDAKVAGVIGHLNSGTTIPASKIYSEAGIPQISPSATNPKYTLQGYKTAFRVVANDGQLGGTLGRYAVKDLKGKAIAIIDDRTAYGQGVADEFEKSVKAAGGKLVGREFTNDKATDFAAILTKLKGGKPDVVFFGGMDAVAGPMLRQMKQLGVKAKFMGGDGICTADLAKLAGDIASTIFHPVGTTRMGRANDPMAVVDSRLKVRGIAGLRVVDAGVMPTITSGNTNSPTLMMAEKAAHWIAIDAERS